ncbi:unnamed protein product [Penicillium salamii]|uniref:Mannan endo-1,6-alpha-mannosidase n=1 Tax=Penicillium salamii TaxID=1612424 RepID=A0A9W4NKN8_9EURO|nr:unnamed protein product [Penicillium salamii]CAG8233307.1 unnamed protein product [Penicillium salamii]CAG8283719.1 unnamed protein product [Penicillium salamii]CAG8295524.1 unnamed protein product [Penicillium salamii]CAG8374997.1 unnamed protein product [Penicillium salamii]
MMFRGAGHIAIVALHILPFTSHVYALELNVDSQESIKNAGSTAASNMMKWYKEFSTDNPGFLSRSWWEGAALFLACLNYWHATNDTTYNEEMSIALQHQGGSNGNYLPSWAIGTGNDDQMFWGLAAITAAEYNFPNRPSGDTWLTLAERVFYNQKSPQGGGWETSICGGGLRWQKDVWQSGYTMKNAVSNGGFFMLAARLAWFKQADGAEFAEWAENVWDWSTNVNLVNNKTWGVADSVREGTGGPDGCTLPDHTRWTYNYGVYLSGAAYMYAYTNDSKWLDITNGLMDSLFATFFLPQYGGVISDRCEPTGQCDEDANRPIFKGLTISWLADIALIIPSLKEKILPKLQVSAEGAAKACTGDNQNLCGNRWWYGKYDGQNSMENAMSGSQMMSAIMVKFLDSSSVPVSTATGGNGTSDPHAATDSGSGPAQLHPITTADRAGAGIMTVLFVASMIGGVTFLFSGS